MSTDTTTPAGTGNNDDHPPNDNSSSSSSSSFPKIPVDREWLQKLLAKHYQDGTTAVSSFSRDDDDSDDDNNRRITAFVLAPMVEQSDLAFRMLCRHYNCNVCFTPMIHAKMYMTSAAYRTKFHIQPLVLQDRPLIAQLCGSDPKYVVPAALAIAPYVDAIDINCGCPQGIARRGMYGAFLLEHEDILLPLVKALVQELPIPLTIKVRLLPPDAQYSTMLAEEQENNKNNNDEKKTGGNCVDYTERMAQLKQQQRDDSVQKSIALYTKLVDAGIHMLTIHGRTRHHKGTETGHADWEAIAQVVQLLGHRIPILANGSIGNVQDMIDCVQTTNVDGIMSSEAILEYPALFQNIHPVTLQITNTTTTTTPQQQQQQMTYISRLQLAREYLGWAKQYPPEIGGQANGQKCIRMHIHRILHADLQQSYGFQIRHKVNVANNIQELEMAIDELEHIHQQENIQDTAVGMTDHSWYRRHRRRSHDNNNNENENESNANNNNNNIQHGKMENEEYDPQDDYDNGEVCGCLFDGDDKGDY